MVEHVNVGKFLLKEGDTPQSVAQYVYNDQKLYQVLLRENTFDWSPGFTVSVPNKKGRRTQVREGEGVFDVIRRMFRDQPVHLYIDRFYAWNGGEEYEPEPGDWVYVPER